MFRLFRAGLVWRRFRFRLRKFRLYFLGWASNSQQVLPPIPLPGTSAHHLHSALHHHPLYASINQLLQQIRASAGKCFELFELDGATSNERLFNYKLSRVSGGPRDFVQCVKCLSHQVNLVEGTLLTATQNKLNLLSAFYGLTQFLRVGGHLSRIRQAARAWIGKKLVRVICRELPPEIPGRAHAKELMSYMACQKLFVQGTRRNLDDGDIFGEEQTLGPKIRKQFDRFLASCAARRAGEG